MTRPSFILGFGLGGFADGIVLHQLLQWHHLVSDERSTTTVEGLEANTLADGLFHSAAWVLVLAGVSLLVRAWQRGELAPSWRVHLGLMLAGWGVFNVVEGVVDHLVLGIHHVRDDLGGPIGWDIGFVAFGVAQVVAGVWTAHAHTTSAGRNLAAKG